jgi:hypothetical protein
MAKKARQRISYGPPSPAAVEHLLHVDVEQEDDDADAIQCYRLRTRREDTG